MTFGLRNFGTTYQRAMNYIFHDLIGRLVEVYIDDVVVKSVLQENHLADLRQVLDCTRKHGITQISARLVSRLANFLVS